MKRFVKGFIFSATKPLRGLGLTKIPVISSVIRFINGYFRSGNPSSVNVDGLIFYLDPLDSLGLSYSSFEPEITALFKKYLNQKSVVIDVGANIGYHTVILSKLAKQVIAFEPEPNNFKLLKKNIEANHCDNIVAVNLGLSDIVGNADLHLSESNMGGHSMVAEGKAVTISLTTLDDYLKGERIDLIKMDIEGAEGLALKGMIQAVTKWKPIMISEFRKTNIVKSGIDPDWFFKVFSDLGYSKTEIDMPQGHITDDTTHNYIFLPVGI